MVDAIAYEERWQVTLLEVYHVIPCHPMSRMIVGSERSSSWLAMEVHLHLPKPPGRDGFTLKKVQLSGWKISWKKWWNMGVKRLNHHFEEDKRITPWKFSNKKSVHRKPWCFRQSVSQSSVVEAESAIAWFAFFESKNTTSFRKFGVDFFKVKEGQQRSTLSYQSYSIWNLSAKRWMARCSKVVDRYWEIHWATSGPLGCRKQLQQRLFIKQSNLRTSLSTLAFRWHLAPSSCTINIQSNRSSTWKSSRQSLAAATLVTTMTATLLLSQEVLAAAFVVVLFWSWSPPTWFGTMKVTMSRFNRFWIKPDNMPSNPASGTRRESVTVADWMIWRKETWYSWHASLTRCGPSLTLRRRVNLKLKNLLRPCPARKKLLALSGRRRCINGRLQKPLCRFLWTHQIAAN